MKICSLCHTMDVSSSFTNIVNKLFLLAVFARGTNKCCSKQRISTKPFAIQLILKASSRCYSVCQVLKFQFHCELVQTRFKYLPSSYKFSKRIWNLFHSMLLQAYYWILISNMAALNFCIERPRAARQKISFLVHMNREPSCKSGKNPLREITFFENWISCNRFML